MTLQAQSSQNMSYIVSYMLVNAVSCKKKQKSYKVLEIDFIISVVLLDERKFGCRMSHIWFLNFIKDSGGGVYDIPVYFV